MGKGPETQNYSKQKTRLLLEEKPSDDKNHKTVDELRRDIYANYRETKRQVFELEKSNSGHLYFFPSSDINTNSKKFYLLGGNSAIIFTQEIAPRIKQSQKLRRDTDLGDYKFYHGICATSNLEKLTEKLAEIGIKRKKDLNEIIVFKLTRTYTKAEIKEMLKQKDVELEKLNRLAYPEVVHPEIHKLVIKLKKEIPPKTSKLPLFYRQTFGQDFYSALSELTTSYTSLARHHLPAKTAGLKMLLALDRMINLVSSLNEISIWEVSTCSRLIAILTDLESLTKRKILKGETDEINQ